MNINTTPKSSTVRENDLRQWSGEYDLPEVISAVR